jgi:SH3-like domain-containing protein
MAIGLALSACGDRGGEGKDCPAAMKARTPSGFCVPRYVSLKRDEVFGRKGPGKDYDALFVYHAKGLPVQIVQETTDWRRICDPDGQLIWIHRSMVDGRRTVMATSVQAAPIRRAPRADSPPAGFLNVKALASLDRCKGDWCKVSVAGVGGWVAKADVWGATEGAQCKAPTTP